MAVTQTALEPTKVKIVEPDIMMERINKLSEQIARRAYEIFERNGRIFGHDLDDWFQAESEILPPMKLQIKEKDEALIIEAETPGFGARDLEVGLEPWRLTISGKREAAEEQTKGETTFQEQSSDRFVRVIDLPVEIDTSKAAATLKNGLLEINLPRLAQPVTGRVDVKVV